MKNLISRDSVTGKPKRTRIDADYIRSDLTDIPADATSVTVSFSSNVPDLQYHVPSPTFENTSGEEPDFQPIVVTNKTVSGFTAKWNAPTSSANYKLSWKTMPKNV